METPIHLKKEITKVVVSPQDDDESADSSSSEDEEESESIKKGIKKFNIESDTDSD